MKTLLFVLGLTVSTLNLYGQVQPVLNDLGEGITSTTIEYLSSGEDINAKSKDYTLLNKAIESNRSDIAMILIEKGADVNLMTNGKAPLVYAIKTGDSALVEALINAGAKVELAYEGDRSAEQLAGGAGHMDMSRMLRKQRLRELGKAE